MFIYKLEPNQIFVFGSNTAGRHGRGAALQARDQFGAEVGVGEGLAGQCYAFPTLGGSNGNLLPLSERSLSLSVTKLYETCRENPDKEFLLTKVGCGLAGYTEKFMRSLFGFPRPKNLKMPEGW